MALGNLYATPDQLQDRLGEADGSFLFLLEVASRAVESFTRRQFNRTDTASPRRFRALDCERLAVDDFHTLDDLEVEVDGVAWDVNLYIDARPWNGTMAGQIDWPFSDLFAVRRSWPWSRRALITVTAQWGWLSVPAEITQATLDVAEAMYLKRYAMRSSLVRSETHGDYSFTYAIPDFATDVPTEMIRALPFRRKIFGVA